MTNMYEPNVLESLRSQKYGWLSADGNIYPCDQYKHFDKIKEVFKEDFDRLTAQAEADIEESLEQQYAWMEENPDEHPEWHHHEIYEMSVRDSILKDLTDIAYSKGWARIGIGYKGKHFIEFEGAEYFKLNIRYYGEEIAKMLDIPYKEHFKRLPV